MNTSVQFERRMARIKPFEFKIWFLKFASSRFTNKKNIARTYSSFNLNMADLQTQNIILKLYFALFGADFIVCCFIFHILYIKVLYIKFLSYRLEKRRLAFVATFTRRQNNKRV